MSNKINKFCAIIILLSLGIIAVYASIQTAFMTGLVTSIVARQLLSLWEWYMLVKKYMQKLNKTIIV